ncbi:MAG: hypothetical protein JWR61_489 [Ferruginibacter sp.]|uniref:glycosyltransferase n=1 Tax=Ferruginibacter sp. TaxID=1940288 RepID=UPI002657B56B|nr:glycosyltransferase [Ferruginibacter sp.]MDB5275534.1 hypothetical protein [Ferruginibacter sp.]
MVRKKLLFLMPSMVGGGAERTLINLLHKIDYSKYEIDLVIVCNKGVYLNQIPDEVKLTALFKNDFFVRVLAYLQKRVGFTIIFRWAIKKKITKDYDLGISFLDGNFTDLLFFIKGLKRRVAWVHSSYKSYRNFARFYENEHYKNKLKINRYGKLDTICFVSHDSMSEFLEVFGTYTSMEVIYNLIDAEAVKLKATKNQIVKSGTFTFIALGSLLPVKGFDRLIRASKIVRDTGFTFNVQIVGKGNEEQNLRRLIKLENLDNVVSILGFYDNPYPLLLTADAFIMSSVSEALPTVLCEAMILGKPVIVTNCSGCKELVDNEKYGLLAEQNDDSLANKMITYLTNPSLLEAYSKKALERAKLFDDTEMLNAYYRIFDKI